MVANARAGGWEEKLVVVCLCPSVVSSSSFVASHFLSTLVASVVVCLFVFMNVCMLGLASFRLRCLFNVILFQVFLSDFLQKFFSLVFAVVGIVFLSLATTFISLVLNNTYIIKLLLLLLSSSSWTVTLTPQFRFHLLPDCYKVGNFFLLFFLACFVTNHFYFLFNTFAQQQQKHKWFKVTIKTEGRGRLKIEFELW